MVEGSCLIVTNVVMTFFVNIETDGTRLAKILLKK